MLSFFPRGVLDEILNLIESVPEGFPSYSFIESLQGSGDKNCSNSPDHIHCIFKKNESSLKPIDGWL